MSMTYVLLLPLALGLGWSATRLSRFIHHSQGSRGDRLTMLVVGWSPLLFWLIALLLSLSEKRP